MANTSPPKAKRKSSIGNLFFFKYRPRLGGIPMDWERPSDDDAYQKMIHDEGFVSVKFWQDDDISLHPIVKQDLEDLEDYLLPTFFEFSQKSKYYQNQFYLYQWIFIEGAFLTTVLGTLASITYVANSSQVNAPQTWQQFLSYMTAIVGAVTAFITALSNRGEPLKHWGKTRRLAEELRTNYFKYLSHLPPYDKQNRPKKLHEAVVSSRLKEQENVQSSGQLRLDTQWVFNLNRKSHDVQDVDLLLRIYMNKRFLSQVNFYISRVRENFQNSDFTFAVTALTMTISSLVAVISATVREPFWTPFLTVLSAILPAFAALMFSFRHLYGWDRQINYYKDALAATETIRLIVDDEEIQKQGAISRIFPIFVINSEAIFDAEASQWGSKPVLTSESDIDQISQEIESALTADEELQHLIDTRNKGMLAIKPTFGLPPSQPQFECDIFMIMPFAHQFQPIYRDNIIPLAQELGIVIKRGDDFFSTHSIMAEIWAAINATRIVIAECSGRNPNVFYELGIAHTLGKAFIMMAQNIDDIPFDLRHFRFIIYENNTDGMIILRAQLKEAITKLISDSEP